MSTVCENALTHMPQTTFEDNSTLVQVMAWCHQEPSHYLNQCWPKSLLLYCITGPQWVNTAISHSWWPGAGFHKSQFHHTELDWAGINGSWYDQHMNRASTMRHCTGHTSSHKSMAGWYTTRWLCARLRHLDWIYHSLAELSKSNIQDQTIKINQI